MMTKKRATSESVTIKKKIKLEDEGNTSTSTTVNLLPKKKCQSEPPSLKRRSSIANIHGGKYLKSAGLINKKFFPYVGSKKRQFAPRSHSFSSRFRSTATPSYSSDAASQSQGSTSRMNSVAKSIQDFNAKRAASAPALSSTASQQGSTPAVRYMGPPNKLVRSAVQQQQSPARPSASSSGGDPRSRDSANNNGDQAGPSILMRIEWAAIDNPFLCGGHPILLQGKGTIPEMMNAIKTQVTRFENSLKKKLAKGN